MRSTLFHIPNEFLGIPVFGLGWALALWLAIAGVWLVLIVRRQGWTREASTHILLTLIVAAFVAVILPRLAEPEGLPIRGYGLMLLLATLAGISLTIWRGRGRGFDDDYVLGLAFWVFVVGIAGARLFYVVEYWERIRVLDGGGGVLWLPTLANLLNLAQGGLVVYGSIVGGILAILIYTAIRRGPLLATMDLVAPSFMLGLALGRIGCFLNGCCFGGVCDLPWAVRFPPGSLAHMHQIDKGQAFLYGMKLARGDPPVVAAIEPGSVLAAAGVRPGARLLAVNDVPTATEAAAHYALVHAHQTGSEVCLAFEGRSTPVCMPAVPHWSLPVHPTQLYSSINALVICLFLLAFERIRRHDGQVLAMMFMLYGVTRFLLEILRDDEPWIFAHTRFGLTIAQTISLGLVLVAVGLWIYVWRAKPGLHAGPAFADDNARGSVPSG